MLFNPSQFLVLLLIVTLYGKKCNNADKSECSNVTSNHNKTLNRNKFTGFIVGGKFTEIIQFPHAVCLVQFSSSRNAPHTFCGSSVLNQRVLLTAAHCVDGGYKFTMYAYGGHEDLQKVTIIRKVNRFVIHENYNRDDTQHDIALLFLDGASIPLGRTSPIKRGIISSQYPFHIHEAKISGWGVVNETSGETSTVLKTATQKVFSLDECEDEYDWLLPGMMCAGDLDSDENRPARGDSGSGLVTSEHQIIGVVSFTSGAHPGLIMYTNVSEYYDWVVKTVHDKICKT